MLLALTQAGLSREDSYKLVQKHAMKVWEEGVPISSPNFPLTKKIIKKLKPAELKKLFDVKYHTKHVDTIFKRVFGKWVAFSLSLWCP